MNQEILVASGINYASGVARFLGDSQLYERLLIAFEKDHSFTQAKAAFEQHDYETLLQCVHALKGVTGNMDMTELYRISGALTELLRTNEHPSEKAVCTAFSDLERAYVTVMSGIAAAQ